ncbi:MAG: LysR family transcriptional regulator [Firmicutes bacterium]|nr:LysR family transcriptional regulator [Bacillota bacterium]
MNIGKLDYFLAAAETGNFTEAADKCGIAQTTMSKYIAQLEDELGVALFERNNKGCVLTSDGHIFCDGVLEILRGYNELLMRLKGDRDNELNLGFDGSHFFLPVFKEFTDAHPDIKLNMTIGNESELAMALQQRKLDAIVMPYNLGTKFAQSNHVETVDIVRAPEHLLISADSIERYGSIGGAIAELPFITKSLDKAYYEFCRENLYKMFGENFRGVKQVQSTDVQNAMVAISQGFAVIPLSEMRDEPNLKAVPLGDVFVDKLQLFYSARRMGKPLQTLVNFIVEKGVSEY